MLTFVTFSLAHMLFVMLETLGLDRHGFIFMSLFFETIICIIKQGFVPVFYAHMHLLSLTVAFMIITTIYPFFDTFNCVTKNNNITACVIEQILLLGSANATKEILHLNNVMETYAIDFVHTKWASVHWEKNNVTQAAYATASEF